MSDSAAQYELRLGPQPAVSRSQRIRLAFGWGVTDALSVLAMLAALAPFMLLAWADWRRTLGAVYGFLYVLALLPVTAVQLWLITEGALLLLGKRPLLIASLWAEGPPDRSERPIVYGALFRFVNFTWFLSPLSGVAIALMDTAFRVRPAFVERIVKEARVRRDAERDMARERTDLGSTPVNPFTELARPVIYHVPDGDRRMAAV